MRIRKNFDGLKWTSERKAHMQYIQRCSGGRVESSRQRAKTGNPHTFLLHHLPLVPLASRSFFSVVPSRLSLRRVLLRNSEQWIGAISDVDRNRIASGTESAAELNPRLFLLAWFRPPVSARSRRNGPLCCCCCCRCLIHQTIDNKRTAHKQTDRLCPYFCFCFNGRRCALCVSVSVCSKRKILAHCSTKRQVHFAASADVAKFASCVRRRRSHRLSK